jgi:isoleucyl-tRNA synthetase
MNWPEIEAEILKFWEENGIFEKSIHGRPVEKAFTFFEGPPSANGMPGIHHVMARAIKDIFCRYKTLQGYRVERKAGWDTHGLPIELQVEKRLGIRKEDIGVKISVEQYNAECRKDVMMFKDVWDDLTRKIGYWVDLQDPYITYENNYIETLWYLIKMLHEKGLLYKGFTIQPFSPAAGTGLSSHELNQPGTYKMVKDTTIVAQFKEQGTEHHYFLAWTTTPWTLPGNTALAVGARIEYVQIETLNPYTGQKQVVTLAQALAGKYFSAEGENADFAAWKPGDKVLPWKRISACMGKDLEGRRYEQLMPYMQPESGDAFKVVCADFVSTEDGTGIVHIAPSFGADDFKTARENGIGNLTPVDRKGRFMEEITDFAGEFVKEAFLTDEEKEAERIKQNRDKYLSVDERIAIKLKQENKAFKVEKYEHSYPHCWRTDKPILYYPLESWFVRTTALKDRLVELNKTINWKPKSTGEGRFGNWLENLVDWNLSRSRYWGTPLPIWATEDGTETKCIGSIDELFSEIEKANQVLGLQQSPDRSKLDLHRPYADYITLVSDSGKPMKRETDLIDVWFDSGAMPMAQWHWPFENKELFERNEVADFIAEGVDQTRGWFFTLHAIAVLLFDRVAFRNVIANGLVLDKFGNKMSKRHGNAVDPFTTVAKYGADAVRWYMVTNAPPWDNLKFDIAGVEEVQRKFFGTLYNTYGFFALYANIDKFVFDAGKSIPHQDLPELDRWIISRKNSLIQTVQEAMDDYDPTRAGRAIESFVCDDLSNWYVRLGRKRFWRGDMNEDKQAAYETLYQCLLTAAQLMSPLSPFFADWLYRSLTSTEIDSQSESVHLTLMEHPNPVQIDKELEETMQMAQQLSSMVLSLRKKEKIRVRQPLQKVMIPVLDETFGKRLNHISALFLAEVNVKEIQTISADNNLIVKKIKPNFKTLGPKLGADMKQLAQVAQGFTAAQIQVLEKQGVLNVDLGNRQFELELADVEILTQDMPGWLLSTEGNITVALDVNITPELQQEGHARELVNRIQNMRKESGLEVTDRIVLHFSAPQELEDSIRTFKSYICTETLADDVLFEDSTDGEAIEIEEHVAKLKLVKAQ